MRVQVLILFVILEQFDHDQHLDSEESSDIEEMSEEERLVSELAKNGRGLQSRPSFTIALL